jgi:hypothetical protein
LSSTVSARSAAETPPANEPRRWLVVLLVVLAVWGLITHGTFAGSGDEPHYAMIAHSLAFDGDLDLSNNYRDATLIGGGTLRPGPHALWDGGRLLPVHDIGMPLAFAPVMRVAYSLSEGLGAVLPESALNAAKLNPSLILRHLLSLVMALLTGLLAREMLLMLRGLGAESGPALRWALLFALTPPILSHSFLFFTEIPSALVTLFVLRRLTLHPVSGRPLALLTGFLTGALLVIHARNVGIVAGLVLTAVVMTRRQALTPATLGAFLAGTTLGAIGRIVTTQVLWGTWVTTPHATLGEFPGVTATGTEMFVRATGLLFDREYGLFAYGPLYILAAPGLLLLAKRHAALLHGTAAVLICYLLPVLLPVTNVHGWTGGWSPAARFLVPVAPLLFLGVYASGADASRAGRVFIGVLIVAQVAINAFVWQFPKTLWNDGDGISAFAWTGWLPSWSDRGAMPFFLLALSVAGVLGYVIVRVNDDENRAPIPSFQTR